MRAAVISPHTSNNGTTTLAMLIALELASSGKLTCITHTKPMSDSFYKYFNFVGYQDKTSTPTQIVKILKAGDIAKDDVSDYCKKVTDNLEAFTNSSTNFSQSDMSFMLDYIAKSFPHEHIVFDIDSDGVDNLDIIGSCDVVVLNINQSVSELSKFKLGKEEYLSSFQGKPLVVVVNKFNSIKGSLKDVAKWMGIKKPNNWVILHENPRVAWATNNGQLNQFYKKISQKDVRVMEINSDIKKIVSTISRASKDTKKTGRG